MTVIQIHPFGCLLSAHPSEASSSPFCQGDLPYSTAASRSRKAGTVSFLGFNLTPSSSCCLFLCSVSFPGIAQWVWLNGLTAEVFGAGLQRWEAHGVWKEGQEVFPCRESLLASAVLGSSTAQRQQREAWVEVQQWGRQKRRKRNKVFKKGVLCCGEMEQNRERSHEEEEQMWKCLIFHRSTSASVQLVTAECGKGRVSIQIPFHYVFLLSSLLICRSLRQITFTGIAKSYASQWNASASSEVLRCDFPNLLYFITLKNLTLSSVLSCLLWN